MIGFRLSPAWSVRRTDDGIVLSGGDDALFEVEPAEFLERLAAGEAVDRRLVRSDELALFEKLVAAEIAVPAIRSGMTGAVAHRTSARLAFGYLAGH